MKPLKMFLIFIVAAINLTAGGKIDSLKASLKHLHGTKIVISLNLISELSALDSPNVSLEYGKKALAEAINQKYEEGKAAAYLNLAIANHKLNNYDDALSLAGKALAIFKNLNNIKMIAKCYMEEGINYLMKSESKMAILKFSESLKIYRNLNDSLNISTAYYNIARSNRIAGDLKTGLENAFESLKYESTNNHWAMNTISILYGTMRELDKSLEYQKKALQIRERLGLKKEMGQSLNNLALICIYSDKPDQSLDYLLKALKIAEELNNKSEICKVLNNIGMLYEEKFNNLDRALLYYHKSLGYGRETDNDFDVANTLLNIGNIYSQQKKYDKALLNLKEASKIVKKIGSTELLKNYYEYAYRNYERKADYKNALENYQLYITAKDSIYNRESNEKISELQIKYETEKKEIEIKLSRLKIEDQEIQKKVLYIGLIALLSFLSVLFYLYYLKNKTTRRLKEEILRRENIEVNLELLVRERTTELEKHIAEKEKSEELLIKFKNELETRVEERTAQLKIKISELEKFHTVTIDREIRVHELMLEIENLKTKEK
ncbi:MAG: tetratricopeptide repeat protein [Melioribacteraceae bacterium]